ncbi:MAG: type II secretion system protein GspC [Deltaproteobacteria bacterium]|nr:type II secretion system protein GspC [Deltaproteobacteria bacterium]
MGGFLKQYLWVLDLVAILLCSFFGAKLTSVYLGTRIGVEPSQLKQIETEMAPTTASVQPPATDFKIIVERNIFDSSEAALSETPTEAATTVVLTGEATKTSLGIKVMGVMVMGPGTDDRSSAIISGSGGTVDTYAVGAENGFAPNTKLTKVKPDRIEFVNNGRLEYALVEEEGGGSIFGPPPSTVAAGTPQPTSAETPEPGSGIKKAGENKFVIDQKEVQNALTNMDQLYTEIRAVPNFAGGKVSGMKILSVKQGSIFDKLGLQRGDILEKINGMELDVKRGFEIFGTLKDEKHLTLDLVRQGSNQTFDYDIR